MDKDEFLRLITLYVDSTYGSNEDVPEEDLPIFIESYERPKPIKVDNGVLDLTNVKSNLIKDKLGTFNNFKIGDFIIKITKNKESELDLVVYEIPLGKNFLSKVDIHADSRFNRSDWSSYFNTFKIGKKIPNYMLPEIIRWIQGINKFSAFS